MSDQSNSPFNSNTPCDKSYAGEEHPSHEYEWASAVFTCDGKPAIEEAEEHDCSGPFCADDSHEGPDNDDWIHDAYLAQVGINFDERLR